MHIDHLRLFYILVREGSFTKAGAALNISQSAVSNTMAIFEYRSKLKLINRKKGTKGIKLTADGERIYNLASTVCEEIDIFWKIFEDEKNENLTGKIKIITTPAVGETILTYNLLPFLVQHPNVKIEIKTLAENINVDVKEADVVIRTFIPYQTDIHQLPLINFHMKLWATEEYLNEFGMPQCVEDLDNHRLLIFEENKRNQYSNTTWLLHVGRESQKPRIPFYQISSNEGLYNAAKKGYGIAQLPEEYVKIKGDNLIEILPDITDKPLINFFYIYSKRLEKTKRIKALHEYLNKCFNAI